MNKATVCGLAAVLFVAAMPVFGAGGGGGGAGGGGGGESAQAPPADPDYVQGVAAVGAKDWPEVVARMGSVVKREPKNADAWNYMGYAHRQMGEMDKSFESYEIALQINPNHRGAREYLGEAYLMVDKLAQAEEQLKALDKLCFFPCEEYSDLKEHIARYKLDHQTTAAR